MAKAENRNARLNRAARRRGERDRPWWTHPAVILGLLAVIGVVGYLVQSRRAVRQTAAVQQPAHPLGPGGSEAIGPVDAAVLVEEYADFECDRCAEFHNSVAPQIRQLAEDGKIRWAFYPMLTRPGSLALTNAAVCAGDHGAFWRYHDYLFANQGSLSAEAITPERLIGLGRQLGIENASFGACVTNGTYNGWASRVTARGAARGIRMMPTVFINGQMVPDPFRAPVAIERALKRSGAK